MVSLPVVYVLLTLDYATYAFKAADIVAQPPARQRDRHVGQNGERGLGIHAERDVIFLCAGIRRGGHVRKSKKEAAGSVAGL